MSPKVLNIFLLVISYILYSYVVSPLYFGKESVISFGENVPALIKLNNTYDATLSEVEVIIKGAKDAKAQYESISSDDRKNMLIMVPESIDEIKLMKELTLSVVDTGIPLDGMAVKEKGGGEYAVSFSVITTYTKFKMYMNYWENSMRLYSLKSVSFNPGKTEDDEIKFSVELSTYYMK